MILPGPEKFSDLARQGNLIPVWKSVPAELEVSASTAEGVVMGLRHRRMLVEGVQFHPESILTKVGHQLLKNFLGLIQARKGRSW